MLPNKVYDVLKWICIVFFPALEGLIASLSHIYNWSCGNVICATIAAVGFFVGALIGVSNAQYYKEKNDDNKPTDN